MNYRILRRFLQRRRVMPSRRRLLLLLLLGRGGNWLHLLGPRVENAGRERKQILVLHQAMHKRQPMLCRLEHKVLHATELDAVRRVLPQQRPDLAT